MQRNRKLIKGAVYLRSDTEDKPSMELQFKRIKAYASEQGIAIANVYRDVGKNGMNTQRPGLQRLLKDSYRGKFSTVIISDMHRLTRSIIEFRKIDSILACNNIVIRSISLSDKKTPNEFLSEAVRSLCSEYYSRCVSHHTKIALTEKRKAYATK